MPEIKFTATADNIAKLIEATLWRHSKTDEEVTDAEWARQWWRKQMVSLVKDHKRETARINALNNMEQIDDDLIT